MESRLTPSFGGHHRRQLGPARGFSERGECGTAIDAGELPPETEPADVAFQLNALAAAASYGFQL